MVASLYGPIRSTDIIDLREEMTRTDVGCDVDDWRIRRRDTRFDGLRPPAPLFQATTGDTCVHADTLTDLLEEITSRRVG